MRIERRILSVLIAFLLMITIGSTMYVAAAVQEGTKQTTLDGVYSADQAQRGAASYKQSCASCHQREAAFSDAGRAVSRGAQGQAGTRNAMPLFNLAWKSSFFWDGRAPSLREQVLQPIENPIEMHANLDRVVARLESARVNERHQARARRAIIPDPEPSVDKNFTGAPAGEEPVTYRALFARAFGTPEITVQRYRPIAST